VAGGSVSGGAVVAGSVAGGSVTGAAVVGAAVAAGRIVGMPAVDVGAALTGFPAEADVVVIDEEVPTATDVVTGAGALVTVVSGRLACSPHAAPTMTAMAITSAATTPRFPMAQPYRAAGPAHMARSGTREFHVTMAGVARCVSPSGGRQP
jgi:hypothetical protein